MNVFNMVTDPKTGIFLIAILIMLPVMRQSFLYLYGVLLIG